MFFVILLFITLLLFCYKYSTRYNNYWRNRKIIQVDGIISKFLIKKCALAEVYKDIYDEFSKEKCVGLIMSQPAILIKDITDVQAVLQGDFKNFYSRGVITNPRDVLADNLLFIDDYCRWRLIRQKISPVFSSKKIKNMFYSIERCARDFVEDVDNLNFLNKDAFKAISALNTQFIAVSTFGIHSKFENTKDSPFLIMLNNFTEPSFLLNLKLSIAGISPLIFNLLNLKIFGEGEEFFKCTFQKVLLDQRQKSKNNRLDFMDTCIELQNNGKIVDHATGFEMEPTDDILAAQAFLFFLAGVDTSTTTMHFTLMELASNSNVLSKLHQEIDGAFMECGDTLTYEAIEKMSYLDMVINESLRKYPPIGIIQRRCTNKCVLPAGNIEIDKGTLVLIPALALHRDELLFPNSNVFDPERFSPENIGNIPKFAYIPFGAGNRSCLGDRFARLQMKSGIAWLLRNHTFKEQDYNPKCFDNSSFAVKDTKAQFELIKRKTT